MRPRLPGRSRRSLAVVVVILLAVGGFLTQGPIGLGNGPLKFVTITPSGSVLARRQAVAIVVPILNPGKLPAVINGITLVGGGKGFPGPHLASSYGAHDVGCSSFGPASQVTAGGCATGRLRLAGLTVPPSRKQAGQGSQHPVPVSSLALVGVAVPPAAGTCWTVKLVAVHYRVGIRHYTATTPEAAAVCGPGVTSAKLKAATASVRG